MHQAPVKRDGRDVAAHNELRILQALRHFGHLRQSEVSAVIWPNSTRRSAYVMTHRTLTRMQKADLIKVRNNALGDSSYILGARGVAVLREKGIAAQEGYNFAVAGRQFYHRTLGTNYLIARANLGDSIYGEYAVLKGWSPLNKDYLVRHFSKIPDGLVLVSESSLGATEPGVQLADWIEVESAYKPYEELKKSFDLLISSPELASDGSVILNRLVFVYDETQGHERRILQNLKRFLNETPEASPELVAQLILLARCQVKQPFRWAGMAEVSAYSLLAELQDLNEFEDPSMTSDEDEWN